MTNFVVVLFTKLYKITLHRITQPTVAESKPQKYFDDARTRTTKVSIKHATKERYHCATLVYTGFLSVSLDLHALKTLNL